MEKYMAHDRNIQHASCCIGEIWTYFPNIMYWLNMISCKRGGFSRIYCLHKEELSHLVSTYQYFSAMPWHKRLAGSLHTVYCHGGLLCLVWVGLLLCKGGILGRGFRGDGSGYPALAAERRPRHRGELTRRGRDEAPLNKQTQHGLRSLSLPYLESLSLSLLSALYLSHVSYNCH